MPMAESKVVDPEIYAPKANQMAVDLHRRVSEMVEDVEDREIISLYLGSTKMLNTYLRELSTYTDSEHAGHMHYSVLLTVIPFVNEWAELIFALTEEIILRGISFNMPIGPNPEAK